MSGLEGLLAGRTLGGRYRVEEVIGRGGFAAVYRARDERLGRTAAVKVITVVAQDAATRDQIRQRFSREARVAASLDHPNVVTVYDVGTDPELQLDFLVMELLQGEDLAHRLARPDPLPLLAAVRILRDAARGIAAGHRGGLIHRDVKPANIFLAEHDREHRFRVCVLDFGIAQIRDAEHSLTRLTRGATPLSPRYASPEQLQESQKLTPAADVYSLGVIGCELLTWERVFTPEQIRAMTRGERPDAPPIVLPGVPPELEATIRRALEWNPEDRFAEAGEMAEALDAVLKSLRAEAAPVVTEPEAAAPDLAAPAEVVPPPAAHAPVHARNDAPRPARRRRSPALLAGIPLLLFAGAGTWWAMANNRPEPRPAEPRRAQVEAPPPPAKATPRPPDSLTWSAPPGAPPGTAPAAGAPAGGTAANPGGAPRTEPVAAAEAPRTPAPPARTTPTHGTVATTARTPTPRPSAPAPRPAPRATSTAGGTRSAAAEAAEADRLFTRGNLPGAIAGFRRAVAAAPSNAYYRNQLGWALFQSGDMAGAERELQATVRLDPRRAIAYANLGEVYRVQGDTPRAVANYRRFLELNREPRRERIATEKLRSMGATP